MNRSNVETIIQELARDNFNLYSDDYQIKNNEATSEAMETAQDLGIRYFEHRNENEIERDDSLNITKIDYVDFVMDAFSVWVQNQ